MAHKKRSKKSGEVSKRPAQTVPRKKRRARAETGRKGILLALGEIKQSEKNESRQGRERGWGRHVGSERCAEPKNKRGLLGEVKKIRELLIL